MTIRAPYNFVPLSRFVFFPKWAPCVSHDVPFADGLSGKLKLAVKAHTPILVSNDKEGQEKNFFRMPVEDASGVVALKQAIPGSEIRGMVRNVLEIASFGKFAKVDDRALSIRDLSPKSRGLYGVKLTSVVAPSHFEARSKGGWLRFDYSSGRWMIAPCSIARVDYTDLNKYAGCNLFEEIKYKNVGGSKTPRNVPCQEKYEGLFAAGKSLDVSFSLVLQGRILKLDHAHNGKTLRYHKVKRGTIGGPVAGATGIGSTAGVNNGFLVFTGQTGAGGKHMEFVFYDHKRNAIPVDEQVMRSFLSIHESTEEFAYLRNLSAKVPTLPGMPVFYLTDSSTAPRHIGLAQMFRLGYEHSIGASVRNASADHQSARPDLAELIFGSALDYDETKTVNAGIADGAGGGLKARAQFSPLLLVDTARECTSPKTVVLNNPRPSYYPNYVRQDTTPAGTALALHPQTEKPYYRSYSAQAFDDRKTGHGNPEVTVSLTAGQPRGWKRYPVRIVSTEGAKAGACDRCPEVPAWARPTSDNADIASTLFPLCPDATFEGTLHFHNLRPVELGALLWTLTWGGGTARRHAIGMAKPLGWGQVAIQVDYKDWNALVIPNDPAAKTPPSANDCIGEFIEIMNTNYKAAQSSAPGLTAQTWEASEQIVQLLAMANPKAQRLHDLEYMRLSQGRNGNEFANAKNAGDVLPEYVYFQGTADAKLNFHSSTGPAGSTDAELVDVDAKQWIAAKVAELMQKLHIRENEAKFGKTFAAEWQNLAAGPLKIAVRDDILRQAKAAGYDTGGGKSWKSARAVYDSETGAADGAAT